MSDAIGRRWSGFMIGMGGAVCMALAGYLHDVFIGTVSVFFVLIMAQRLFGDASYAIIGPYIAEVWPNRLSASGMGFSYGIGNLGKIIGPLGFGNRCWRVRLRKPQGHDGCDFPGLAVPRVLVRAGGDRVSGARLRD
jgi:MFS family permease